MSLPNLPATIDITVNGAAQTITGKPNKENTRMWYSGSRVIDQRTSSPEKALGKVTAAFAGEVLKAGEVHQSAAQVYRAGHPKAGQVRPNTGGNWTVTHSGSIELQDAKSGDVHRFTLMVTVTYVDSKGFVVSCKAIPQAVRAATIVGDEPSFVDDDDLVPA